MRPLVFGLGLCLALAARPVLASACDDLGGGVVFKDTLYGGGTGLVLTGLALAAAADHEETGRKVALGTLIGAGTGTVFGVVETLLRDCRSEAMQPGWQKPSVFWRPSAGQEQWGMRIAYVLHP